MNKETVTLNDEHTPQENAIEAFNQVEKQIKAAVIESRQDWNKHEPEMWRKAANLSDDELTAFTFEKDLVAIRSGGTPYGSVILGKIRIPALGDGYIHVRVHDPPNRGVEDVVFHSLFTDEGNKGADGKPTTWDAIQDDSKPLDWFDE